MRRTSTILWNVLFPHALLQQLLQKKVGIVPITVDIPQILSPSRSITVAFIPIPTKNTAVIVLIAAVITVVTAVLLPFPSPCHSLQWTRQ